MRRSNARRWRAGSWSIQPAVPSTAQSAITCCSRRPSSWSSAPWTPLWSASATPSMQQQPLKAGIGQPLLRKEDARHLRGRGQFVAGVKLPSTHEVAFVRSPHAHARIKKIHIPPDAKERVFTSADLASLRELRAVPLVNGFKVSGYPPLAKEKVRYAGEPIAACIARTRAQAEDLASSMNVDFELLPAVVDCIAARKNPVALLHENWG